MAQAKHKFYARDSSLIGKIASFVYVCLPLRRTECILRRLERQISRRRRRFFIPLRPPNLSTARERILFTSYYVDGDLTNKLSLYVIGSVVPNACVAAVLDNSSVDLPLLIQRKEYNTRTYSGVAAGGVFFRSFLYWFRHKRTKNEKRKQPSDLFSY